jgi:hypothetical protein
MQWTPELDKAISDLHAKRLGNAFIAKWLRLNPSHVRARLMELGLLKSRSAAAVRAAATQTVADASHDLAGPENFGDDADDDMVRLDGCPRGYLVPERRIASIYQTLGRGY